MRFGYIGCCFGYQFIFEKRRKILNLRFEKKVVGEKQL